VTVREGQKTVPSLIVKEVTNNTSVVKDQIEINRSIVIATSQKAGKHRGD
jgi:hypothetical protein